MKQEIITGVAVMAALFFGAVAIRGCMNGNNAINSIASTVAHKDDTTEHWKDQYNTEHGRRIAAEGSRKEIEAAYLHDMDSAAIRIQQNRRQIDGLVKALATAKGSYTAKVDTGIAGDTTALVFHFQDSSIKQTGVISDGVAHMEYEVNVPIFLTQYRRKKWLLGKEVPYIDGYSSNPNVRITGLQSVRIDAVSPGRFGVGPYVGIGIDMRPSVGVAVFYSLFRF